MGAPVAAATTLARTKIVRRAITLAFLFVALVAAAAWTPLVAIPFAIAGAQVAAPLTSDSASSPTVSGEWGYPLAGGYSKGRGFGYNPVIGCSYCTTNHMGYDMAQECGATIYAAGPGTIVTAGVYQGYGNTVRIDHGDGLVAIYGHMQWNSLRVTVGQQVTAGTPLGAEGNTGKSFGCHLHLELRLDDTPIDPEPFMAARGLPLQ